MEVKLWDFKRSEWRGDGIGNWMQERFGDGIEIWWKEVLVQWWFVVVDGLVFESGVDGLFLRIFKYCWKEPILKIFLVLFYVIKEGFMINFYKIIIIPLIY